MPKLPTTARRLLTHPAVFFSAVALCIVIFILSMILTYGPIVLVEARYQYKRILSEVFHADSLRSLILPTINTDRIGVKYREFGMEIPEIYLNEPVVFNVDPNNPDEYKAALSKGIAHAAGTDLPPYQGLGYYFAHSSSPELKNQYNAVFYLLGKLQVGDSVNLWYENNKYEYQIVHTVITEPDDVSFLNQPYEVPTIVLQTCWPPGTTQKRLLLFAERKRLMQ
ncbi:class E sortase [Patescibacteria group bacterium]|nr:class E sortase [Patescibacteria group bacterium]